MLRPVPTGNVATHAPEGLGEGSHHDIHVLSVHAAVFGGAAACLAQGPDAVGLVYVNASLSVNSPPEKKTKRENKKTK